MMAEEGKDMAEKKLRGSGGYAIARITDEEQKKGNLGGPELFLAGIGRLGEDRFTKYYCNKCEKEYEGAPSVIYENPNEELGEGVTLVEKGEYKCKACSATIAQYRKFDASATTTTTTAADAQAPTVAAPQQVASFESFPAAIPPSSAPPATAADGFISIQSLVGMSAYDSEAMLIGRVEEVGLRRKAAGTQIAIRIAGKEVPWEGISKIGDIVLLKTAAAQQQQQEAATLGRCPSCGYQNEADSAFCAECGFKL